MVNIGRLRASCRSIKGVNCDPILLRHARSAVDDRYSPGNYSAGDSPRNSIHDLRPARVPKRRPHRTPACCSSAMGRLLLTLRANRQTEKCRNWKAYLQKPLQQERRGAKRINRFCSHWLYSLTHIPTRTGRKNARFGPGPKFLPLTPASKLSAIFAALKCKTFRDVNRPCEVILTPRDLMPA